jgi:hypothetical protein
LKGDENDVWFQIIKARGGSRIFGQRGFLRWWKDVLSICEVDQGLQSWFESNICWRLGDGK